MSRRSAAWLLVLATFAPRTLGAEPCPPRAELDGDPVAVARVRDELRRLGVAIGTPAPGCRTIKARVELAERGGVAVAIADGTQRSEGRTVSDAALAAAWIDSWTHDDLDAVSATPALAARPAAAPAAPPARSVFERGALAVGYEQAFTGDVDSWTGGSAAGCANVGPVCVGARVRYAHQGTQVANAPTDQRTEVAALATATTGFALGKMAFAPELGLGLGRLATRRDTLCKTGGGTGCDPSTDPNCGPPSCVDAAGNVTTDPVSRSIASYEPRAAAALRVAVPLFEHVWLDAIASVTFVPFAHTDPFKPDPKSVPLNTDPGAYTLPGEPTTSIQLGIGLRVGGP